MNLDSGSLIGVGDKLRRNHGFDWSTLLPQRRP